MDISLHDKNELKLSMVTRQTAPVLLHHRPTGNQTPKRFRQLKSPGGPQEILVDPEMVDMLLR